MAPVGGASGRTEPEDVTAPATPSVDGDPSALLAEAAAWWDLRDEMTLHVLGLHRDADDFPGSVRDFMQAVLHQLTDRGTDPASRSGEATTTPPPRDEPPAGDRVAHWRRLRGLTQHDLARRLDTTSRWVAAVERGIERISTIDSARRIAAALRIDLPLLAGRDPRPRPLPAGDPVGENLERVRAFLEQSGGMVAARDTATPSLAAITLMLRDAWQTFHQAEYGYLLRALPRLLHDAALSDRTRAGGRDGPEAARLLSQAYQVTAAVLHRLGEHHLSWLTADRAIEAASRGQDPVLTAAAARFSVAAMLAMGRAVPALNLTRTAMLSLLTAGDANPAVLVVRGSLMLHGAAAAARQGDTDTTRGLLATADVLAVRLGSDTDRYWAGFGPTAVELSRASTAVDLGDGTFAVAVGESLSPARLSRLSREQHAGHWLTLARAHLQAGSADRAVQALEAGTRLAPAVARRPLFQEIELQVRTGRRS